MIQSKRASLITIGPWLLTAIAFIKAVFLISAITGPRSRLGNCPDVKWGTFSISILFLAAIVMASYLLQRLLAKSGRLKTWPPSFRWKLLAIYGICLFAVYISSVAEEIIDGFRSSSVTEDCPPFGAYFMLPLFLGFSFLKFIINPVVWALVLCLFLTVDYFKYTLLKSAQKNRDTRQTIADTYIIRLLNGLATCAFIGACIFLAFKVFSSNSPALSNSIRSYEMSDIRLTNPAKLYRPGGDGLDRWFKDSVIVTPYTDKASVILRFRSKQELFSAPALVFQLSYYIYFIMIVVIIYLIKRFINALAKNDIFIARNIRYLQWVAVLLIALPVIRWITQKLLLRCIEALRMNDSGLEMVPGSSWYSSTTYIGFLVLALALVFKAGRSIQQENEDFV